MNHVLALFTFCSSNSELAHAKPVFPNNVRFAAPHRKKTFAAPSGEPVAICFKI